MGRREKYETPNPDNLPPTASGFRRGFDQEKYKEGWNRIWGNTKGETDDSTKGNKGQKNKAG